MTDEKDSSSSKDNHHKAIAVLGAAGGIGSELCHRLAKAGTPVIAGVRDPERESPIDGLDGVTKHQVDAEDWDSLDAFFKQIKTSGQPLGGLVVCIGSILLKPAHLTKREEYDETIRKNVDSAFGALRAAVRLMMKSGGSIVLMSSGAARHGFPHHEAIAAAKGALIGLTLSAAATYAPQAIRVNCVAPGLVDTPLAARITANESSLKTSKAMHALGRIGSPKEIASAIAWLLSEEQSWITGQVLGVDGGLASIFPK